MRVKKFRPRENRDKLVYGDGIVEGIVLLAVSEIPYAQTYCGITGKKNPIDAIKVYIDKMNVDVDVTVSVHYSQCVSDMAFKIQEAVKYNVESMTDYNVVSVNVNVKGVTFEEIPPVQEHNGEDKNGSEKTADAASQS